MNEQAPAGGENKVNLHPQACFHPPHLSVAGSMLVVTVVCGSFCFSLFPGCTFRRQLIRQPEELDKKSHHAENAPDNKEGGSSVKPAIYEPPYADIKKHRAGKLDADGQVGRCIM